MKNLLADRIKGAKLTKTQKRIADYFLQNQERIGSLSSMEIAQEIGVSDASIIRFSRVIGFDGYADLKDHIYNMLVQNAIADLSLSERAAKNREAYGGEPIPEQFQHLVHQNIASVFRNNTQENFEKLAKKLVEAENRYVIGLRGCRGTALDFGRLLTFMLPNVRCLIDGECASINLLQDIGKNDVLVMFVFTRYYKIDVSCLRMARERGAFICVVQNEMTGALNDYADMVLEADSAGMAFFNSNIGMMMLMEYLLTLVGKQVEYKERLEQRETVIQNQLL